MSEEGFNDSELEDIMNEIESLEKEFMDDSTESSSVEEISEDPVEASTEESDASDIESEVLLRVGLGGVDELSKSEEELKLTDDQIKKTNLQSTIEDEVESMLKEEAIIQEPAAIVEEDIVDEVVAEETPEEIIEEPIAEVEVSKEDNIVHFEHKNDDKGLAESKMSFEVSGQMNLALSFYVKGQTIQLHVNENDGFVIEMDGGAKFSIPLDHKKAS